MQDSKRQSTRSKEGSMQPLLYSQLSGAMIDGAAAISHFRESNFKNDVVHAIDASITDITSISRSQLTGSSANYKQTTLVCNIHIGL